MNDNIKEVLNFLLDTAKTAVLALAIVIPIRYFLFQPFIVSGSSMSPYLENGDYLLIDEISYRLRQPNRGEIVVFDAPNSPGNRYIKRVIGLPEETVEIKDGKVLVFTKDGFRENLDESKYLPEGLVTYGDEKIVLGENEYFVLGDNRIFSSDSRSWGVLPAENIIGRAFLRAWPFDNMAFIQKPFYDLSNSLLNY